MGHAAGNATGLALRVFAVLLHISRDFSQRRRVSGLGGAVRRVFFSAYGRSSVQSAEAVYKMLLRYLNLYMKKRKLSRSEPFQLQTTLLHV